MIARSLITGWIYVYIFFIFEIIARMNVTAVGFHSRFHHRIWITEVQPFQTINAVNDCSVSFFCLYIFNNSCWLWNNNDHIYDYSVNQLHGQNLLAWSVFFLLLKNSWCSDQRGWYVTAEHCVAMLVEFCLKFWNTVKQCHHHGSSSVPRCGKYSAAVAISHLDLERRLDICWCNLLFFGVFFATIPS